MRYFPSFPLVRGQLPFGYVAIDGFHPFCAAIQVWAIIRRVVTNRADLYGEDMFFLVELDTWFLDEL